MESNLFLKRCISLALMTYIAFTFSSYVQAQDTDPYIKERANLWSKENYKFTPWTTEQKLFALSKFWSEVKRNFVFMEQVGVQRWDSLYQSQIIPAMETKNDWEFELLMNRFCAFLKDGHTNISVSRFGKVTHMGFDALKWNTLYVDGRFIVNKVSYPAAKQIPAGSEIVEVNGIPAMEHCRKNVLPRISGSTDADRLETAGRILLEDLWYTKYVLKMLLPNKKYHTVTLYNMMRNDYGEESDELPGVREWAHRELFKLEWIGKDIAYLKIGTFGNAEVVHKFNDCLPELQQRAKKLILDIRTNGGGNTAIGTSILGHLTNDTLITGSSWSTRTYNAAFAAWGKFVTPKDTVGNSWNRINYQNANEQAYYYGDGPMQFSFPANNYPRLVVPTVVLTSVSTYSAAEDFLVFLENQKHITTMGQTTGGSTGQPIRIDLIPDMSCRICTKNNYYTDGRIWVGKGIVPDIEIPVTFEDYKNARDRVLEEAVKFLKKKD